MTRQELETGRAALTRGYPRNFETAEQISRGAAQLALYGLPDDYFSTFVPKVLAVDEAAVTRVAMQHIDPLSPVDRDRRRSRQDRADARPAGPRRRGRNRVLPEPRRLSSEGTGPAGVPSN